MLNKNHQYSQHASKALLSAFVITSVLVVMSVIVMIILKTWWPIVVIGVIVAGWFIFNALRKTVMLYDLTDKMNIVVANNDWLAFKKNYPNQVVANGKKE
ncbi:hypothetical protein [Listeria seeligeri]|uniref:hypothetical protein n=1 Tax=Listeria seeligeri TaxID=1640 RepID=UPI0022EBEA02|nr:hypothetical protein [Listeria seeligeri]